MWHLGLLGGGVVLSTSLAVLGTAELYTPVTAQVPATGASDNASHGAADLSAFETGELAVDSSQDERPTCMGHPASPGGVGTSGDDVLVGTPHQDVIVAGAGNDVVLGRDGKDVICGGPGDDRLVGGRNPADWSQAKHGDRLSGGTGDDRIIDRWGFADKLIGGPGADRLVSSNGMQHKVIGGPGADRLISRNVHDNTMLGGRGPDVLTALSGGGYSRYHAGGAGRDIIDVGPTGDILVGLTGDGDQLRVHGDAYVVPGFSGSPVGVEVDMAAGIARRIGASPEGPVDVITFLAPELVEWFMYGSDYGDRMSGSDGDDSFSGGAGNDVLVGLGGRDGLYGDHGDDLIDGGDGDDRADGGAGTDNCLNAEEMEKCES
jgi:Ca2+-binding RTX toxin-like protein